MVSVSHAKVWQDRIFQATVFECMVQKSSLKIWLPIENKWLHNENLMLGSNIKRIVFRDGVGFTVVGYGVGLIVVALFALFTA